MRIATCDLRLMVDKIYKIVSREEWRIAREEGAFTGSEADRRDGFIHLSAPWQLRETAARHFTGQNDLLLLAVEPRSVSANLKWEISRAGDFFPHLHAPLAVGHVMAVHELPLKQGGFIFPAEIPA